MSLRERLRQLDRSSRAAYEPPSSPSPSAALETPFGLHAYAHGVGTLHGDVALDAGALDGAALEWIARTPDLGAHPIGEWVFLDTETTGLAGGAGTVAFLIGLGRFSDAGFVVRQYLMRDYPEEPAMLAAALEDLATARVLVTYNGKSFDVPLLRDRAVMQRRQWPLDRARHVDLLHTVRRLWRPRLGAATLTHVEAHVLGYDRPNDLPGWQVPEQFFRATREQNPELLDAVMEHNRYDILSLAALTIRASQIGRNPLGAAGLEVEDLLHVGRTLEAAGRHATPGAAACYERAADSPIAETATDAKWRRALLAKRQADWPTAERLWRDLVPADWPLAVAAIEELAKLAEHRKRHSLEAADWCHQALGRLERARALGETSEKLADWERRFAYRLARVARKLAARPLV